MDLVNAAPGQCRLEYDSATALKLTRRDGAYLPLKISGTWQAKLIPSTPPTLSNAGLTAATRYYVYAFDNAGTLTLEASTTGYASDTDVGVMVKTGDPTRTLVGMAYMGPGSPGTFVNSAAQRFVRGWFNRESAASENRFTANRSTASGTFVELNAEIRVELLNWADENVRVQHSGVVNASSSTGYSRIGMDATPTFVNGGTAETVAGSGHHMNHAHGGYVSKPSEGYHFFSLYGRTDGGASHSWLGGGSTDEAVNSLRAWVERD